MKKNIVRFGLVLTCLISLVAVAVGDNPETPPVVPGQSGNAPQEELSTPAEAQPSASAKPVSEMKADQGSSTKKPGESPTTSVSRQKPGSTMSLPSSDAQTQRSAIEALNQSNTKLQEAINQLNAAVETFRAGPHDAEDSKLPGWLTGVMYVLVVLILVVAGAYGFLAVISTLKKEVEGVRDELRKGMADTQKQGKAAPVFRPAVVAPAAPSNSKELNSLKDALSRQEQTLKGVVSKIDGVQVAQQQLKQSLQTAITAEVDKFKRERDNYKSQCDQLTAQKNEFYGRVKQLEGEKEDLRTENTKLVEQKQKLGTEKDALAQDLQAKQKAADELRGELDTLTKRNAELESHILSLEANKTELGAKLTTSQAEAAGLRKDLDVAKQTQQTMEKWKAGFWPQSVQDDRLLVFFQEAMAAAIGGSPEANWLVSCLNGVHLAETNDLVPYEEILHLTGNALCRYAHTAKKEEKELHEILTQLSVAFRNSEKGKATGAYCRVPTLGAAFDTAWVKSETGATRTERINNWCVMNGRGRVDRMASVG